MPYSTATTTLHGSTNIVTVPFPYTQQADVYVYNGGVLQSLGTDYNWLTSSTIQFTASAASLLGDVVTLQRITALANPYVTFASGPLDPNDLNRQSLQLLYALQEATDYINLLTPLISSVPTVVADVASATASATAAAASAAAAASLSGANGYTGTGAVVFANSPTLNLGATITATGAAPILAINAPSASYSASVVFEQAGAGKWTAGLVQNGTDPFFGIWNISLAQFGLQIDYTTNAATFANNITGNGTLTMSGTGQQTLSLTQTSNGALNLFSLSGTAYIQNTGSGYMSFNIASGAQYAFSINSVQYAGLSTGVFFVNNPIQSTSGGFKFPDNTLQASAAFPSSVRQTVMSGPGNSSPSILPSTSASLSITSQNISGTTPLIASVANGFGPQGQSDIIGQSTSNLTWSGLTANTTNYLLVTVSGGVLTPLSTTIQPIFQYGGTISVSAYQFTFDILQMKMFEGNGTTAPAVNAVFVGEAATNASTVTSTVAYAYNRQYVSALQAIPGLSTSLNLNHNLGVGPIGYDAVWTAVCITANNGYSVGEELPASSIFTASYNYFTEDRSTRNSAQIATNATGAFYAIPKGGGGPVAMTNADWNLRLSVKGRF